MNTARLPAVQVEEPTLLRLGDRRQVDQMAVAGGHDGQPASNRGVSQERQGDHRLVGCVGEQTAVAVYLAILAPGSRRTMREARNTIAGLLGVAEVLNTDSQDVRHLAAPWGKLCYAHTVALRSTLKADNQQELKHPGSSIKRLLR